MQMTITLNAELDRRVREKLASGLYQSVDDVLCAAMRALDDDEQTIAEVKESYEDYKAGRYETWEKSDADFRAKHGIPKGE
jgi:putative addiction module CopG family antidote